MSATREPNKLATMLKKSHKVDDKVKLRLSRFVSMCPVILRLYKKSRNYTYLSFASPKCFCKISCNT